MTQRSVRLKFVASVHGRIGWHGLSTDDYADIGDYLVTGTELTNGGVDWSSCHRVSAEVWERDPHIRLEPGDVLVSKDGTIGKVALVENMPGRATLNSGVFRVTPKVSAAVPRFIFWTLQSKLFSDFIDLLGSGSTISHLYERDFVNFGTPLPSRPRQLAVADYLDTEIARIDAIIADKQRMIELVQERVDRQVESVCLQVNAAPRRERPDQVPLPEEVPNGWVITPLGAMLRIITYGFTNPMPVDDDGPCMLTANDIEDGQVRYDTCRHTTEWAFRTLLTDKSRPMSGDVLVTKDGSLGRVALVDGPRSCINQSVALLRPDSRIIEGELLVELLRVPAYRDALIFNAGGTTIKHLYISRIVKQSMAIPPTREGQRALLRTLHSIREWGDRLSSCLTSQLGLLADRRAGLIVAAVTGTFEVDR